MKADDDSTVGKIVLHVIGSHWGKTESHAMARSWDVVDKMSMLPLSSGSIVCCALILQLFSATSVRDITVYGAFTLKSCNHSKAQYSDNDLLSLRNVLTGWRASQSPNLKMGETGFSMEFGTNRIIAGIFLTVE